ncbi:hypothetical protein ACS0TY_031411 [Phlomoides rotata]
MLETASALKVTGKKNRNLGDMEFQELYQLLECLESSNIRAWGMTVEFGWLILLRFFSVKSFLLSLCSDFNLPFVPSFKCIWKIPISKKVHVFLWLVVLGKVPPVRWCQNGLLIFI